MQRKLLLSITFCLAMLPHIASANDVRIALLIGHQHGWADDPKLNYILKGDLRPMARELKQVGFNVTKLENPSAQRVRQAFDQLKQRLQRAPRVTTVLFYYTGHADRRHFHLGHNDPNPFSYEEFQRRFFQLQTTRRIAIIDACHSGEIVKHFGSEDHFQELQRRGKTKGVRARRATNLIKRLRPSQGNERGLRVIASSRFLSWELKHYGASVFTYHFLRGLRGKADQNQDGKISLDELFDYARQKVYRDTRQRPQQFKRVIVGEPYALAPAYRSQLNIDSQVVGDLKVSIGNFVWFQKKARRQPLQLLVVDGKGSVFLKRQKQCWHRSVIFPKQGSATLTHKGWTPVKCKKLAMSPKGSIQMEARPLPPPDGHLGLEIALWAGYANLGSYHLSAPSVSAGLSVRKNFLELGLHMLTGSPPKKSFRITRALLRSALGYPRTFTFANQSWTLYLGVYTQFGLAIQHKTDQKTNTAFSAGGGGTADLSWWWSRLMGLRLGLTLGLDYTPVQQSLGVSFHGQGQVALLLRL